MFSLATKKTGRLYLLPLMFPLPAFAVISLNYLPPAANPPSACAVFFIRGEQFVGLCSGNIVGKDKLLTAGHCAPKDDEAAYIRCPHSEGRELMVKGFLVHPYYTAESVNPFDLALFQAEGDFFSFAPAPLPKSDKEIRSLINEGECVIYGYGRDSLGSAENLRGGPVTAGLNDSLGFEMAVVGGGSVPVEGDSGGGLYCRKTEGGRYVQTGVISKTGASVDLGSFGLAVPVSTAIRDWIESYLEEDFASYAGWPGRRGRLRTVPPEEMESAEECLDRLIRSASSCAAGVPLAKERVFAEISRQCSFPVPPQEIQRRLLLKAEDCSPPVEALAGPEGRYKAKKQMEILADLIIEGAPDLPRFYFDTDTLDDWDIIGQSMLTVAPVIINHRTGPDWKLERGDLVAVTGHRWVTLVKPIGRRETGDVCSIDGGGLEVVGFYPPDQMVLMKNYPTKLGSLGALCPEAALFFVSLHRLKLLQAKRSAGEDFKEPPIPHPPRPSNHFLEFFKALISWGGFVLSGGAD